MNQTNTPPTPPLLKSFPQRLLYWIFIPAAPIFNFSFISILAPEWQRGKFSDYMLLMLSPEAAALTLPLLGYSVLAYLKLISNEESQSESIVIRFGVYTGVILAFHYSLLTALTWEEPLIALVSIIFIFLPILISTFRVWIKNESVFRTIIFGAVAILILWSGIAAASGNTSTSPIFFLVVLIPMSAPFWCFFIALQAARWLWKYHEPKLTLAHGLGLFAWLTAYGVALSYNISKMYELYAALPTQPPDCYIATAATNGHPIIVGSHEVQLQSGKSMRVNKQLQNLKCAELALQAAAPRLHKILRAAYDMTGKPLARKLQNPFLADVAYLLLKPFEWIAILALNLVLPTWKDFSSKMYNH